MASRKVLKKCLKINLSTLPTFKTSSLTWPRVIFAKIFLESNKKKWPYLFLFELRRNNQSNNRPPPPLQAKWSCFKHSNGLNYVQDARPSIVFGVSFSNTQHVGLGLFFFFFFWLFFSSFYYQTPSSLHVLYASHLVQRVRCHLPPQERVTRKGIQSKTTRKMLYMRKWKIGKKKMKRPGENN